MTVGSLFAGIGGFDLGLERAGFEIRWQVENDPYCTRVLAKQWPRVRRYGDIRGMDWRHIEPVDLLCGGFPCQPFSCAGQRRGTDDDRYLWPEMRLAVLHAQPAWIIAENVPGLVGPALDTVLSDLESAGYEVGTLAVPACAVDAPHLRQRLWILAHREGNGLQKREWEDRQSNGSGLEQSRVDVIGSREDVADAEDTEPIGGRDRAGRGRVCTEDVDGGRAARSLSWATEPDVGRVAHGVPHRVDRLRGLGNAIVPQIAEWLGRRIMECA